MNRDTQKGADSQHLFFPLSQMSREESIFKDPDKGLLKDKYKPIFEPIIGKQLAVNTYYANDLIARANTPISLDILKVFDELKINFKVNRSDMTDEERDSVLDAAMARIIKTKRQFLDELREENIPAIQASVKTFLDHTLQTHKIRAFETHFDHVKGYLQFANSAIASEKKYIGTAAALERVIRNEKRIFKLSGSDTGETIEHVVKTAWLSLIMAEHLPDFDERDCEKLSIICMGHDGGKALVPESVLYKKGRLTQVENDIMKSHVLLSYMLSSGNQEDPNLENFAMALHHIKENPDIPSSYGICKNVHTSFNQYLTEDAQAKLEAVYSATRKYYRVISIADTFEAIAAERVYKAASSIGKTLTIMLNDNKNGDYFYQPYLDVLVKILLNKFVPKNSQFTITNRFLDTFLAKKKLSPAERTLYKDNYKGVITNECRTLDQGLHCVIFNRRTKQAVHKLTVPPCFFLDQTYFK